MASLGSWELEVGSWVAASLPRARRSARCQSGRQSYPEHVNEHAVDRHGHERHLRRGAAEFLWFGIKQARACFFAGLFFAAVFVVPRGGETPLVRRDRAGVTPCA